MTHIGALILIVLLLGGGTLKYIGEALLGFVVIMGFLAGAAAVYFFVPWQTALWVVVGLVVFIALELLVIVKGGPV